MYASRILHVEQRDNQRPKDRYKVQIEYGGKPVKSIQADRIKVDEEVMYWRQAYHIHAWFVCNVQNGQDDCKSYYVGWDKLSKLLGACQEVIRTSKLVKGWIDRVNDSDNPKRIDRWRFGRVIEDPSIATQLLPTRGDSYFGSVQYDECYLDDVIKTRDWAKSMLAEYQSGVPGDIYYSSSR